MAAIRYAPRTDKGQGFLPLVIRALGHLVAVAYATFNKWPMTVEQAHAELLQAIEHINQIGQPEYISTEGREAITRWKESVNLLAEAFRVVAERNPENLTDAHLKPITDLVHTTWAFCALMDTELIGLTDEETDAGREA